MPHTTDTQPDSTLPAVIGQASPSRRQVLRGVAAAGAVTASGLLVACGGGDDSAAVQRPPVRGRRHPRRLRHPPRAPPEVDRSSRKHPIFRSVAE